MRGRQLRRRVGNPLGKRQIGLWNITDVAGAEVSRSGFAPIEEDAVRVESRFLGYARNDRLKIECQYIL